MVTTIRVDKRHKEKINEAKGLLEYKNKEDYSTAEAITKICDEWIENNT